MASINIENVLWAAGFFGHAALLYILLRKNRARTFPIFTSWIFFMLVRSMLLFAVRSLASKHVYFNVYWTAVVPDYILQLGVLYEICRLVLLPYKKSLPRIALYGLIVLVGGSAFVAFLMASSTHPSTVKLLYSILRFNLAFSLLRCGIFATITIFSDVLGLSWKHHVQRLALGLAVYSLGDVCVDAVRAVATPGAGIFGWIGYFRTLGYLAALAIWIFSFFEKEPARGTLSPEAEVFLGNLQRRLSVGRRA